MAALQRPYRGSRVASFYPVKSLPPISSLDSAFQLQEYISLLIRLNVHDVDAIVALPGKTTPDDALDSPEADSKKTDDPDRKGDISVDKACWIYEQLRRLAQDLSHPLITMLQQECTRSSCPQMKAGEWLYLCVAHGNDGAMEQCCAIDYILHTVDSATALLNSPRAFPSRLSIPQTSHRHFSSLARRLGRIFAHAYFHHREAFEQAEAESSLYARFLKLTSQFDLVPVEFLVIPKSALHHDDKIHTEPVEPPRLPLATVPLAPNIQHNIPTAAIVPDGDQPPQTRPRPVDTVNQLGTDSPRRLGRSRTDTMVFSEAYSMTEEFSKGEAGSPLGASPDSEIQPSVSDESWPILPAPREDTDDEDTGDARSEVTLTGPLSPPVETLPLISIEDTPNVVVSDEVVPHDVPLEPSTQIPPSDATPVEASPEEPPQAVHVPEKSELPVEASTSEVTRDTSEESYTTPSEANESIHAPSDPGETAAIDAHDDPVASSREGEEPRVEPEMPPPSETVLELNEPPPSEPIPPESESDITDEVGGLDGDEVRAGED